MKPYSIVPVVVLATAFLFPASAARAAFTAGATDGPPATGMSVSVYQNQQHFAYVDHGGNVEDAFFDGSFEVIAARAAGRRRARFCRGEWRRRGCVRAEPQGSPQAGTRVLFTSTSDASWRCARASSPEGCVLIPRAVSERG